MSTQAIEKPQKTLKDLIMESQGSLAAVATKHLAPEKLIKCALVVMNKTPALKQCTPSSVLESLMACSQLGLDPSGGVLGEAYLIPYGKVCQLILGYKGLTKLATRSGEVVSIQPWVVYKGEKFHLHAGTDPRIEHEPDATAAARDDENIRGFYAVAKMREGFTQFAWMSKGDVDKIRKRSRAGNNGPWVSDYAEMGKKTVVRRLVKQLPLSSEASSAIEVATKVDPSMNIIDIEGESQPADEGTAPQGANDKLAGALGGKPQVVAEQGEPFHHDAPQTTTPGPMTADEQAAIKAKEAAENAPKDKAGKKDAKPATPAKKPVRWDDAGNPVEE